MLNVWEEVVRRTGSLNLFCNDNQWMMPFHQNDLENIFQKNALKFHLVIFDDLKAVRPSAANSGLVIGLPGCNLT